MKELTEAELVKNYESLLAIVNKHISKPRAQKLIDLYDSMQETMVTAPASGKEQYHNCFIGGYVAHVLHVVKCAQATHKLWEEMGANIDYTNEELIFSALNHDLGKLGDGKHPYYVPNPSEWHRKNQGALYTSNPKIAFMPVPDRSLYLLQANGIDVTMNEFIAIKIHDGLYDEANKAYLMAWSDDGKLRSNLPRILAEADILAAQIEYEEWKEDKDGRLPKSSPVKGGNAKTKQMNALANSSVTSSAGKIFDDLFN